MIRRDTGVELATALRHRYATWVRDGVPAERAIVRARAVLRAYLIDQRRRLDAPPVEADEGKENVNI